MNQSKLEVWKVTGYHLDDGSETLFEAYFTDKQTAEAVFEKGEREYGGVDTGMCWMLDGLFADNVAHVEQMFEDVHDRVQYELSKMDKKTGARDE